MVIVVTSPIPETGCGCGARVPFSSSSSPPHQLTIAEVQDVRGVTTGGGASASAYYSGLNSYQHIGNNSTEQHFHHHQEQLQQQHYLSSAIPLIRSKTSPAKSSPPLVITQTMSPTRRASTPPPDYHNSGNGPASPASNAAILSRYAGTAQQQSMSLECDYDLRPTELYKSIQGKNWERVLELLESDNAIQASIWVVRKEPSGQLRWRLLPLHAALIFQAPYNVIESLLGVYPAAAAAKDDQGMVPLHLALRNSPIDWMIVEELLTAHPGAVGAHDRKGRSPLDGATTRTNDPSLSVLKLYTQIAVARERSMATSGGNGDDTSSVASSSLQLTKLLELQQQVEHEREMWKQQIQVIEATANEKIQAAEKKQDELQEQVTILQAQQAMSAAASPTPHEETELWKELCLRLIQQQEKALDLTWLQTVVQNQQQQNQQLKADLEDVQEQARAMMIMTPDTELRKEDILTAKSRARMNPTPSNFKITVESTNDAFNRALNPNPGDHRMRVRMVEEKKESSSMDRVSTT